MSEFKSEDGYPLYSDVDDRLKAAHRAAGWPEPTEDELEYSHHGAELLTDVFFYNPGPGWPNESPEDRIADGLSVEAINAWNAYRQKRNALGDSKFRPLGRMPAKRSQEDWSNSRSISDLDNPFRPPRPLCIVAENPKRAYPLDRFDDWVRVPMEHVGPCGVQISAKCHSTFALQRHALVRGEYITIHRVCQACYRWPFAFSSEAVEMFRQVLVEHRIEPTNVDRRAELLALAERGVL